MFVILMPEKDLRIRKEDGSLLSSDGEKVKLNPFWKRKILNGDVLICVPKKVQNQKPAIVLKEKKKTKNTKEEEGNE